MTARGPDEAAARAVEAARLAMQDIEQSAGLTPEVEAEIERLRPRPIVIGLLTYNNAGTVKKVAETVALALQHHCPDTAAVIVNADAGSSDGTPDLVGSAELPAIRIEHAAPLAERLSVPFHGVPGRGGALHATFAAAHRLGMRALVLLEVDVVSMTEEWIDRLVRPVLEDKADLVVPAYVRHRYDGTITNLLLSPLVRALYGRRVRQPLGGQQALSARLVEHLLLHPRWHWAGREISDLWVLGAAIADGFAVWETWLGPRIIRSGTRTTDLPPMVAQTLGSLFALMRLHADLWTEVRGSEPLPEIGPAAVPSIESAAVDVTRMIDGFMLGVRDLVPIWELILAPETFGDVLSLGASEPSRFRFPDELWARVVYDFALGYHYDVVYRDHLLRSLVPLYLGRTAAFVLATQDRSAQASEALLEAVGDAFERQKSYLVERWR
jgi:glucosylglycerate synthase